jgi:hypothetical protein
MASQLPLLRRPIPTKCSCRSPAEFTESNYVFAAHETGPSATWSRLCSELPCVCGAASAALRLRATHRRRSVSRMQQPQHSKQGRIQDQNHIRKRTLARIVSGCSGHGLGPPRPSLPGSRGLSRSAAQSAFTFGPNGFPSCRMPGCRSAPSGTAPDLSR